MISKLPAWSPRTLLWASVVVAIITIGLKTGAWLITDSVGLLSDAMESLVNLASAIFGLMMVTVAAQPADEEHPYGHHKAEYFSSGFEGILIIVAALAIIWTASHRIFDPKPIEQVGWGLALSVGSSALNGLLAWVMFDAAKRHRSIALEADAKHLVTDVWTSIGVVIGIGLVSITGWLWLDAVVAIGVALNILKEGFHLIWRSSQGLMDEAVERAQALLETLAGDLPFFLRDDAGDKVERPLAVDIAGFAVYGEGDAHRFDGIAHCILALDQFLIREGGQVFGQCTGERSGFAGRADQLIEKITCSIGFPVDWHTAGAVPVSVGVLETLLASCHSWKDSVQQQCSTTCVQLANSELRQITLPDLPVNAGKFCTKIALTPPQSRSSRCTPGYAVPASQRHQAELRQLCLPILHCPPGTGCDSDPCAAAARARPCNHSDWH